MIISKDVLFNEFSFPYLKLFEPLSPITSSTSPPVLASIPLCSTPTHIVHQQENKTQPSSSPHVSDSNTSVSPSPHVSVSSPAVAGSIVLVHSSSHLCVNSSPSPPQNTHSMVTRSKAGIFKPRVNPYTLTNPYGRS